MAFPPRLAASSPAPVQMESACKFCFFSVLASVCRCLRWFSVEKDKRSLKILVHPPKPSSISTTSSLPLSLATSRAVRPSLFLAEKGQLPVESCFWILKFSREKE